LETIRVYNKSRCFDPFPFPICGEAEKKPIRKLAEELDAHRKRVQAQHGLTLTGLYNVLEKIRAGEKLTDKEKFIHDAGLVSVLKQLHDDLDAAVFAAYGWPATLTDAEILERLVALNAERAAEEKRGIVHWLRPEYQAKGQAEMILPARSGKAREKIKTKTAAPKGKTAMAEKNGRARAGGRSRVAPSRHRHARRTGRAIQTRQARRRGGNPRNAGDDGPRPPAGMKNIRLKTLFA
jgi:hypothetical protein